MKLADEVRRIGRRNFLKAVGGVAALAGLGTTAVLRGPKRGGPVRVALIGYGDQGKVLHNAIDPDVATLAAICEIQPTKPDDKARADNLKWYRDWRQMLRDECVEAVLIATPTWTHAEMAVVCLAAGKHVFCETPMTMNAAECQRMIDAAHRNRRVLQIGYQEFSAPHYQAAYRNILQTQTLGEIYSVEAVWHTDNSGRKPLTNAASFDPRPWGYASMDEWLNWRLYRRYSNGLAGEWGGALVAVVNWFFGATPTAVQSTGGIFSYPDGRENADHVYATLEYPAGRTLTLSLIQSNGFGNSYIQFMGTQGTLILSPDEALLFTEQVSRPTSVTTIAVNPSQPVLDTSASRSAEAVNHSTLAQGSVGISDAGEAFRQEIAAFCGAIRTGAPLPIPLVQAQEVTRASAAIDRGIADRERIVLAESIHSSSFPKLGSLAEWFEYA